MSRLLVTAAAFKHTDYLENQVTGRRTRQQSLGFDFGCHQVDYRHVSSSERTARPLR
jgi:hypothetical protein